MRGSKFLVSKYCFLYLASKLCFLFLVSNCCFVCPVLALALVLAPILVLHCAVSCLDSLVVLISYYNRRRVQFRLRCLSPPWFIFLCGVGFGPMAATVQECCIGCGSHWQRKRLSHQGKRCNVCNNTLKSIDINASGQGKEYKVYWQGMKKLLTLKREQALKKAWTKRNK